MKCLVKCFNMQKECKNRDYLDCDFYKTLVSDYCKKLRTFHSKPWEYCTIKKENCTVINETKIKIGCQK